MPLLEFDIKEEESKRQDCPYCGGNNCFSYSKRLGSIFYLCHRAGCNIKGVIKDQYTVEDLEKTIKEPSKYAPWFNNQTFVSTELHTNALNWLIDYNCEAWKAKNPSLIRYDAKQDRVVFLIENNNEVVDAVGAYLGEEKNVPKWYRYGTSSLPFVAETINTLANSKKDRTCFIVEDCASACSVSRLHVDGLALLGTNTTKETILKAAEYLKVYIALDRDALETTMKTAKIFNQVVETEVLVIDKDLKYYDRDELYNYFKGLN